jgi:AbrB family looped-hinge helix DNA binding protein
MKQAVEATITSKGRVTLPKNLRKQLHLAPGDRVLFLMGEDGSVHLLPKRTSVKDLKGIVPKPDQPVSLTEMERVLGRGASD